MKGLDAMTRTIQPAPKTKGDVMLKIEELCVDIEQKTILDGVHLELLPGEVHCIMGPNGSGKSTLAQVLAGRDGFEVRRGRVTYSGEDLLALEPHERALRGLFLAFQYPTEIPGVSGMDFLRGALNARRSFSGEEPLDAMDFVDFFQAKTGHLPFAAMTLDRSVNDGFSGGEKKQNEMVQMAVLEPSLVILDEVDSGLDIDALKNVARVVNAMRAPDRTFLLITHYQRLLNYIKPDHVHVLVHGRIVRSGGMELALELEERGYAGFGWTDGPTQVPSPPDLDVEKGVHS